MQVRTGRQSTEDPCRGAGASKEAARAEEVTTWLDEPENAVNLKVTMQARPDGVSYPGSIVFAVPKRQLEVTITKSNCQKIAQ